MSEDSITVTDSAGAPPSESHAIQQESATAASVTVTPVISEAAKEAIDIAHRWFHIKFPGTVLNSDPATWAMALSALDELKSFLSKI